MKQSRITNLEIISGSLTVNSISNAVSRYNYPCFPYPENYYCDWAEVCNNDNQFYFPFIKGDKIYLQWQANQPLLLTQGFKLSTQTDDNWLFDIKILDAETEDELSGINLVSDSYGVGWYNYRPYQYAVIDTNLIPYDTFIISFISKEGEKLHRWYSEFYKDVTSCPGIKTVVMQGFYCLIDSERNAYNSFITYLQSNNEFEQRIRLQGELVLNQYSITQTIKKNKIVSNDNKRVYTLTLYQVPERIADKINLILTAQRIFINGIEIIEVTNIEKNFTEGEGWFITMQLNGINFTNEHNCLQACRNGLSVKQYDDTGCNDNYQTIVQLKR